MGPRCLKFSRRKDTICLYIYTIHIRIPCKSATGISAIVSLLSDRTLAYIYIYILESHFCRNIHRHKSDHRIYVYIYISLTFAKQNTDLKSTFYRFCIRKYFFQQEIFNLSLFSLTFFYSIHTFILTYYISIQKYQSFSPFFHQPFYTFILSFNHSRTLT